MIWHCSVGEDFWTTLVNFVMPLFKNC